MKANIEQMFLRMEEHGQRDEVVEMHSMFKAMTSDIVTRHAFADSFKYMHEQSYGKPYYDASDYLVSLAHYFGNFPLLRILAGSIPDWITRMLVPSGRDFVGKQLLNSLPYLKVVINEVLRLHPGTMHRQVRIFPDDQIIYTDKRSGHEYVLLPGRAYGISPLGIHMNADTFKDLYEFRPQRRIDNPKISRAFMTFSRGSRGCVSLNLARHELSMILASIFLKYDAYRGWKGPTLELYGTIRGRDINAVMNYILPFPARGSPGFRIRVRN
ncbi:hypothetical protein DL771_006190 [Monosporascus sp. 5C6A]|nr:hypothetical protein DL771_006190 [Monosporascus sp. 5C6A]